MNPTRGPVTHGSTRSPRGLRLLAAVALAAAQLALGACMGGRPPASVTDGTRARPSYAAQFDLLWEQFALVYPSFAYKGMDWRGQRAAYRARATQARSQDELIAIAREMLEPLRDLHVWFVDPRGQVVPTYRPARATNFDRRRWERALRGTGYVQRSVGLGEATIGGYAYLYLNTWKAPVDPLSLDLSLGRMQDTPGLIIDLRTNAGGSDATALAFLARFTTRPLAASYVQTRTGPDFDDLDAPLARVVPPRGGWQYTRPIVLITGRGGFSATESFVAAMRTLPNVTVIGDTTGGASGNPATFALGNGWQFTVPRWIEFGPDHEPIEGRGVPPHVVIPWQPSTYDQERDPLIDAAVGILGERNGVFRIMAPEGEGSSNRGGPGATRDRRR